MTSEVQWAKVVGWFAVVLCVAISARGATVYAKNSPRVFTVLALFSLNWALLIPYYSQSNPPELLACFAGFLLVYIGVLLRREVRNPLTTDSQKITQSEQVETQSEIDKTESSVARGDRIALWLLGLIIAPSLISLPFSSSGIKFLNRLYTEPVLGSVVTLIGYYSIWSAIRIYSSRIKLKWLMFAVLVFYTIIEVTFTIILVVFLSQRGDVTTTTTTDSIDFWSKPPEIMNETFLILFAIMKVLFVVLFIYLVLYESVSDEDRKLSITDKILKLFGL